jgi:glycerophosphoryl diester phosphodiesterase
VEHVSVEFGTKLVQLGLLVFISFRILVYLPTLGLYSKGLSHNGTGLNHTVANILAINAMRIGLLVIIALMTAMQLYAIATKRAFLHYRDVEELYLNPASLLEVLSAMESALGIGLLLLWLLLLVCASLAADKWHTHCKRRPLLQISLLVGLSVLLVQEAYRNSYVIVRNSVNNLLIVDDFSQVYPSTVPISAQLFFPSQLGHDYSVIAHAGGGVIRVDAKGQRERLIYTNSYQAVEASISDGKKLIELDLLTTSDGELIAGHDWPRVKALLGYRGISSRYEHDSRPLSFAEFSQLRQHSDIKPLDLVQINQIFKANPELILVTDKTDNFPKLVQGFSFPERLIVECFSLFQCQRAKRYGIVNTALNIHLDNDDIVDYLQRNQVTMVTFRGVNLTDSEAQLPLSLQPLPFRRAKAIYDAKIVSLVYTSGDDLAYLQQHIGVTASTIYTDFFSLTRQTLLDTDG